VILFWLYSGSLPETEIGKRQYDDICSTSWITGEDWQSSTISVSRREPNDPSKPDRYQNYTLHGASNLRD
jgi:hypothetical protein